MPTDAIMKFEDKLKNKVGTDPGFTVPDGYFEHLGEQMVARLPEIEIKRPTPVSRWHRIRPYVYLAAMFAGIWCMMKMFHTMTSSQSLDLENPPALVAQAIDSHSDPLNLDSYMFSSGDTDYEVEQEVVEQYSEITDLMDDFDYTFEPEYNDITVK